MTGWTLFFVLVGVAFLTAQFFRLIDLIERPAHRTTACRRSQRARLGLPEAWNVRMLDALNRKQWMFWKS